MATLTLTATDDSHVRREFSYSGRPPNSQTWAQVVTNSTGTGVASTSATTFTVSGNKQTRTGNWGCYRGLINFDLSTMPAGAVITGVTLELYANLVSAADTNGHYFNIWLWDEAPSVSYTDYDAFAVYSTATYTSVTSSGNYVLNINDASSNGLLTWLQNNPQGDSNNAFPIMLRNYYDVSYQALADPTGFNTISFRGGLYSGAYTPELVITYTVPVTGYGHNVLGVVRSNISKINGIATADISKVNGV